LLLLCQNVFKIRLHSVDNFHFDIPPTKSTKEIMMKIGILMKNRNFVRKSEFSKIGIFKNSYSKIGTLVKKLKFPVKNQNFGQKTKFSVKNRILSQLEISKSSLFHNSEIFNQIYKLNKLYIIKIKLIQFFLKTQHPSQGGQPKS